MIQGRLGYDVVMSGEPKLGLQLLKLGVGLDFVDRFLELGLGALRCCVPELGLGHGLGLALGSLMALQLFLTTNLLVIRGTADQSPHAALLINYFPGYDINFVGSLIGAVEIFAVTYILSFVLSQIYNGLVARRHRRPVP